jgi:hypothetical protein
MKYYKFLVLFVLSTLFVGCAKPPLSKDVATSLRNSKVAVAYVQSEKKIHYNEEVYKVFWIETRTKDVSFEGLWDIDADLSAYIAPRVGKLGLNAVSLHDVVSDQEMKRLYEAFKVEPQTEPLVLNDELRSKLLDNGIGYLVTLNSRQIYVNTQIGVKVASAFPWLYVQEIQSNKQLYGDSFPCGGNLKVEKNIREIENNNLALLKSSMKEWLDDSISKWMPKKLGLVE